MYRRLIPQTLSLFILLGSGFQTIAQSFSTTDISLAPLTGASSVDGGDYDNDGDLDLLVRWNDAGTWKAEILRNTSTISSISFATTGLFISNVTGDCIWADMNNDGKLDIIASGSDGINNFLTAYINNAGAFTTQIPISTDLASNLDWGDVDADGDQDLLVTTATESFLLTRSGPATFSREMPESFSISSILADFDLDGDLDVIGDGIYTNRGDEFLLTHSLFPTAYGYYNRGKISAMDLDGDGDRDLLRQEDTRARGTEAFQVVAYFNQFNTIQQNTFSRLEVESVDDLVGPIFPIGAGDFDNNGDVEMIYVPNGNYSQYLLRFKEVKSAKVTTIDLPANSRFHSVNAYLIADLNGDQKLDIITVGGYVNTSIPENVQYAKALRNLAGANAKPTVPTGADESVQGGKVTLSWNKSTDATTPSPGITYNFYLRQGLDTLVSSYTTKSGKPRVHNIKGTGEANKFVFPQLANNGSYSWAVQSRDAAGNYSAFTTERTFPFSGGNSDVDHSTTLKQQSISYDQKNNQYVLVGLQGGDVYAVLLDGKFGERKSALKKLNQFTTGGTLPKVAVDSVGTYLVTWIGDSLGVRRVWGKFLKNDLSVPQANEWRACEKFTDPYAYVISHDVRYNPARSAFDMAWAYYGETGGISARRTRLQSNVNKPDPIKSVAKTGVAGWLHGGRGYLDVSIDSDPKANKSVIAYTFESERPEDVTSYGKMFFRVLDQNLGAASKDSLSAQLLPNQTAPYGSVPHIVYNPYLKNFTVIWNAHFQHQASTLPQDGVVESRDVAAAILTIGTNGLLTMYQFPTTISKAQQQGGQGGALNPNLAFNYDRNEFLATWHNTNAGKIYGHRINPLDKVTIDGQEFQVKDNLSETPATSYARNYNHFILGYEKDGNGTTSILDLPNDPAPIVNSLSKSKAYAGDTITISGSNFGKTPFINAVYFGSIRAKVDTLFWSRTKLKVRVPTGLTRDKVPVVVYFDGQKSNSTVMFENITVSVITSVSPSQGSPGDLITITGTNFPTDNVNNFKILFGTVIASESDIITPLSSTTIKVKVPQNAARGPNQAVTVLIQDEPYSLGGFTVIRIPSIASAKSSDTKNEMISDELMDVTGTNLYTVENENIVVRIGDVVIPPDRIELKTDSKVRIKIPWGIDGKKQVYFETKDGNAESLEYSFRVGADIKSVWLDNKRDVAGGIKKVIEDDFPLRIEVYNKATVKELKFLSKGITKLDEDVWQSQTHIFDYENSSQSLLNEADLTDDPLGLQFYFEVIDSSGVVKRSDTLRVFHDFTGSGMTSMIPDLRFGGSVADYNIISIPYKLNPNKINIIFKSILDQYGYDNSKWRIAHYQNETGDYAEYTHGLDDIDQGKGYWIIARNAQEIPFDIGTTLNTEKFGPFEFVLQPGWNQIGNPYDFKVSWDAIIAYNKAKRVDTRPLESFKTFNNGSFQQTDIIDRFKGGFVRNNSSTVIKLKVPFTKDPAINGRKKEEARQFASKLDEKEWRLAIDLTAGELKNRLSSFGMHPQANDGVDEKDEHKLPAFVQSLDLAFPQSLSTSIVGTDDHYSWQFDVTNTTESNEVTITWDNSEFGDNDRELFLQDLIEERLIDMRKENHYTFAYREGYSFKIHFGDQSYIENIAKPSNVVLSDAYPNPMHSTTSIPFTVTKDRTHVHLAIYTLQGQELQTLVNDTLDPGFYELEWDGKGPGGTVTSGVVIYRLQTSESANGVKSHFKKLVIAP